MWFNPDILTRLHHGMSAAISTVEANELQKKRAAEKAVEESGVGTCSYCEEEIVKNETLGYWESDFLVGYCAEAKDHKHHPIVHYSSEEGVVTVEPERDDTPDAEPVPGFWGLG